LFDVTGSKFSEGYVLERREIAAPAIPCENISASNPAASSIRCQFTSPMLPAMTVGGKLATEITSSKDGQGFSESPACYFANDRRGDISRCFHEAR